MPTRRRTPSPHLAVAYVRVSTDDQQLGPEAQRAALERWAVATGTTFVAILEDIGVSGATPLPERPGLVAALAMLESSGAASLVVAKRDRLARDPMISAMVEAACARFGARVVSAAGEGTEDDGPTAILMRRIVDAFAEYERLLIRARTRAALAVKRGRGEKLGGATPYGYALASDGIHLEPDPDESAVVARVLELRAAGLSLVAVADRLTADGVPPRGSRWHATTIARMIKDRPPRNHRRTSH